MPIVKNIDTFLQRSLDLLLTNPANTRISITYGSQTKKLNNKTKITKPESDEHKSFVSFKVYDPVSGELHKYNTHKVKDLSKVMTALGPHGVQIATTSSSSSSSSNSSGDVVGKEEEKKLKSVRGFASVLANAEIEEDIETGVVPENAPSVGGSGVSNEGGKKKNKKKGKK